MEKKIIFIVISLFLFLSYGFALEVVNSSFNDKSEQKGLEARIKSIEQSKYYIFNSEINFNSLAESSKIAYDDSGKITFMETYGSENFLICRYEYCYDKNGRLKKTLLYKQDNNLSYKKLNKYDSKGFITRQIVFDKKAKRTSCTFYKNDEQGRVIEEEQLDANNKTALSYITKKYDNQGNIVEMCHSTERDGKTEKYLYYYDSENHMTGRDYFDESGNLIESLRYKYEYDENGNWVQRTITNMNMLVFVEKRDIIYF
ncbi:MAG TPA: hypothetical protein PKN32_10970 [Bacteroidales bacterium]|nr:hypothetical protein [Bacteroidales bacterium]